MNVWLFQGRMGRWWLIVLAVLLIGAVSATILHESIPDQQIAQSDTGGFQFDVSSFLHARRIVDYEQPAPELARAISAVYSSSDKDVSVIPESSKGLDIVLIDNVPFYHYWQDEVKRYVFHPMAYGRFLARLDCNEPVERYVDAAIAMAQDLPNGGLLWYYPNNYRLNRFLGPDLSPSAMSQGQILGAITGLDERCQTDLSEIARRVFLGLSFDYYDGGVNLEDRTLLEIPLFRSAPEIILNGWLHALLHLNNYVKHYRDPRAEELLASNIQFLAKTLDNFHDKETGLSLYSDLCPYRVRVHHETEELHRLTVFYKARSSDLDALAFDLKVIGHDTQSPYDNQIIRETQSFTDIWINCSQNYETYLVSDRPVTVSFSTGKYSPYRSTPGTGGERIELESEQVSDYHVVNITSVRDKLFCGYPTNFSKMGENYYHTYHVVALACLIVAADMPNETPATLRTWMERCIRAIESTDHPEGLAFASYDKILNDLFKHKVFTLTDDWDTLWRMAREAGR